MKQLIILYSTGCPKCQVLKSKMEQRGISYTEVNDLTIMESKGILNVPVIEVDGLLMEFKEANNYINSIQQEE